MALSWVATALGAEAAAQLGESLDPRWRQVLGIVLAGGPGHPTVLTSSAGRLFDAVAALVGLRKKVTYEGQAAIELEMLARSVERRTAPNYPADIIEGAAGEPDVLDPSPLLVAVLEDLRRGRDLPVIAAGFHEGLGRATALLGTRLARRHGLETVALSGGVFQNRAL